MENFLKQLRVNLSKFSLPEIKDLLELLDGNTGFVSWGEVASIIRDKRLKSDQKTVVDVIVRHVKKNHLDRSDQRKVLVLLELNDAAYHRNRKWQCIRFSTRLEPAPRNLMKLNENIISCYRREARDADVLFMEEDGEEGEKLAWLMVSEKKTSKRGVTFLKPIIYVVNLDVPHRAFYSGKNSPDSSIQLFGRALGFESCVEEELASKDVRGMFGMLQRNEACVVNQPGAFVAREPIIDDGIMDFTQENQREEYAETVFSESSGINQLAVKAEYEFQGGSIIPGCRGVLCKTKLTFINKSGGGVEEIFKQLVKDNSVQLPLPDYMLNFNNVPKTSVELKSHRA